VNATSKHFIGIKLADPLHEQLSMVAHAEDADLSVIVREALQHRAEGILKKQDLSRSAGEIPRQPSTYT